jgi:hypothetical protein
MTAPVAANKMEAAAAPGNGAVGKTERYARYANTAPSAVAYRDDPRSNIKPAAKMPGRRTKRLIKPVTF